MSEFEVPAAEAEVLDSSHLVQEIQQSIEGHEQFETIIGKEVATFHDVSGGYHRSDGYHLVNLVHEVQGDGSPLKGVYDEAVEIHGDEYFYLEVADAEEYGEYPDEDYVLSLHVTGYEHGPHSFAEALDDDIDKRETRYE